MWRLPKLRSGNRPSEKTRLSAAEVVQSLYEGLLGRAPDEDGFRVHVDALRNGVPLSQLVAGMAVSEEFRSRHGLFEMRAHPLPDLVEGYPEHYTHLENGESIFHARSDADFRFIESLLSEHRYYDSFGVWTPTIDLDKRVTAALVEGLGASSCLELGCFTGPVLSLLAERGIAVRGVEVSHLAFLLAYENVRAHLRFGDLLAQPKDREFDCFLGMDILEHLSPLDLDRYVADISARLRPDGFAYINSPMFGRDDVFGEVFPAYLPDWRKAGDAGPWRQIHCDARGWPMHGHLVWASPAWWETLFRRHGLIRLRTVEQHIHALLRRFFKEVGPARQSLFVLAREGISDRRIDAMRLGIAATLARVADLPR